MYIKDKDGNYVPTPSSKGADGREVSLRVANNYIQWRYPDTEWTNLVPLSDLKGEPGTDGIDGREVHMRVVSDTLQWRLGDSGTWQTLMSLSTVTDGAAFGGMVVDKTLVLAEVEAGSGGTADAVTYTPQTLTEEQKSQARTNIGAVDENLGCNKYNIHVTTTSGTTKDFTYYTNIGEIRQPAEAVDSSIRTAFLSLTLWPDATSISENLAKTLSKQYKILYDANYIDSPCRIIKSPLESGDNVLLSYHSSDNTVQVAGSKENGFYNIIYDVANDVLTYFYVSNNIIAVNGAVNQLVMSAAPTEDMHIATKQYVDTAKSEAQQLGLTTATPGKTIKVKTVQDGKPTEWEAVDMPGGDYEFVQSFKLSPDVAYYELASVAEYKSIRINVIRGTQDNALGNGNLFLQVGYGGNVVSSNVLLYLMTTGYKSCFYFGEVHAGREYAWGSLFYGNNKNTLTTGNGFGAFAAADNKYNEILENIDQCVYSLLYAKPAETIDGQETVYVYGVRR